MTNKPENHSKWIVETTAETFERDVFERSHEVPIVVDFWAAWCAPCRALGPILEQLTNEFAGEFVLVKADTDAVPEAAAKFNVQGIPAVYAVLGGEIVDFFTGALPEEHVRAWLDRICLAGTLADAKRLEETSPSAAEAKYWAAIARCDKNESAPRIGLARTLLAQEKIDECREIMQELEDRGFLEPEAEKIKSALELRAAGVESVEQCRREANADPDNLALQYKLARALAGGERFEEALQTCLSVVERNKAEMRDKARELMVDIFRVLPDDSELTGEYRRKLSMAMY